MGYAYEIHGTKGAIRFDQEDQNALWLYRAEGPEADARLHQDPDRPGASGLPAPSAWGPAMAPAIRTRSSSRRGISCTAIAHRQARLAHLPRRAGRLARSSTPPSALRTSGALARRSRMMKDSTMTIRIGNAPCSWGVEFADDPRNPPWRSVLKECAAAGYKGIELGPIGFMPEDPAILGEALAEHGLTLIGGVVFRPFHDPAKWDEVMDAADPHLQGADGAWRAASGADRFDLAPPRADRRAARPRPNRWTPPNGRPSATGSRRSPRMGAEEYGLTVAHPRPCRRLHRLRAGAGAAAGRGGRKPPEDLLRHRPPFLCGLRSRGLHAAPHRAHFLHALQGHRPRGEGRCRGQAHRVL